MIHLPVPSLRILLRDGADAPSEFRLVPQLIPKKKYHQHHAATLAERSLFRVRVFIQDRGVEVSQSYIVLARKWRPAQFADIVGQGPVVKTLMNAIRQERIHQAYLLTGTRGIGKTSIARIFAKALQCPQTLWEGDSLTSCGVCSSCQEITRGTSMDVMEIDGASNNGVDAIREIRESAKYAPSCGKKKIYIIDEVHMLTTAAFNALLKTLEEPPPHVVFIFATTESHKIPGTIHSRVQRFDLRRVTAAQIQTRLQQISQAEGIEAEPAALMWIARAAEGSMRDALSILDQVIAYAGKSIQVQHVRESIGLIESQVLTGILDGILSREPLKALKWVDRVYQSGQDLKVLTKNLLEAVHALVLFKIGAESGVILEFSQEETLELKKLSALRELEELELIFQAIHHSLDAVARSSQPKMVLDILIVKCAKADALFYAQGQEQQPSEAVVAAPKPTPTAAKPAVAIVPASQSSPAKPMAVAAPVIQATSTESVQQPIQVQTSSVKSWENFVEFIREKRPLLGSILEHGDCLEFSSEAVVLAFKSENAYFKQQIQQKNYWDQLHQFCQEYLGKRTPIRLDTREFTDSMAERRVKEQQQNRQKAVDLGKSHPLILEARALFGGELGEIELTGENGGHEGI